jgi:hypothetical protein
MVFEKSSEEGRLQQQSRQQTQKAFAKTLQILRKNRPAYAITSNNR